MAAIDYSQLGRAVQRLNEGLTALNAEPENSLYRDAVIQRFEFTYGLCATMLERFLKHSSPVEPEQKMTFPALIRAASDLGVLHSGWDAWSSFREARNLTSHVYNEEVARKVLEKVPAFAEEASLLYSALEKAKASDGD